MIDNWLDLIRLLIFALYGLTVGHVLWIVRLYYRHSRRLLPRHIAVVGVAFVFAITEVAWQNAIRVGEPYSHYVPINMAIMAFSLFAMRDMRKHLHHRPVTS